MSEFHDEIMNPVVFVQSVNKEMTYHQFVNKLFKHDEQDKEFMHAALGITGEAGEIADAIKKHAVYGKPLDRANVVEELGDLRFYMQQLMNMLDISEDEVLQTNANKLSKRYPAGQYSDKAAVARADKQVYSVAVNETEGEKRNFFAGPFDTELEARDYCLGKDPYYVIVATNKID